MEDFDYPTERRKLLEELCHHHGTTGFVAVDRSDPDNPHWVVGTDPLDGFPSTWAGLPIRYAAEPDFPRSSTRDWLRRTNPINRRDV